MKIKDRIYSIYLGIKKSIRRFPLTIGFSVLLSVLLIYFNENRSDLLKETIDKLIRIQLTLGMGILLSLSIDLLKERFFKEDRVKILVAHTLGIVFLVVYYNFFLDNLESLSMIRYVGIMIFLFMAFFYTPRLNKKNNDYEYYVIDVFLNIFITALYSIVLLLGVFAILFTISALFDVNILSKFYYYTFLIIFFIFAIPFFLSKVPENNRDFTEYNYSKSLRILLSYIVIPLISIYTVILYVYFAKILISWEWPKGLVSHLVLWYSSISVGIIFLINKISKEDKVPGLFRRFFPKVILPILLMMFISIGQRINQYGITENRYYILALGIWVTAIMVYFAVEKSISTIIIPISLSLIVLNSVIGPLSSFSISKFSQNRRLNNILELNGMLSDNEIIKNPDISQEAQREINNIIYYFDTYHDLNDIKLLEDDFNTSDMEDIFGFDYKSYLPGHLGEEEYFYLHTNLQEKFITIEDYDYYINMVSWGKNKYAIGNIIVDYNNEKNILVIKENDDILINIDLIDIIKEIHGKINIELENNKGEQSIDEMAYEIENDHMKLKMIFTNISGNINNGKIQVRHPEFLLFLKKK